MAAVLPPRQSDPLAPLLALPGVAEAVARARDAVVAVHNHPVNRRGWPASAAEASLRAARASAALDGAPIQSGDAVSSPVLSGAVRAAEESGRLLGAWRTAPLQVLARLHVVAAADLVPAQRHDSELGRPRVVDPGPSEVPGSVVPSSIVPSSIVPSSIVPSAEVPGRLSLLADLITGGTAVPAPVLVAVVHGELLALAPFRTANGVVARAAARLTAIATGFDPKGLCVPEVGHLRHAAEYRSTSAGFAAGTVEGIGAWLLHCCEQWEAGATEGLSIADART
jgi:hypothetical protein